LAPPTTTDVITIFRLKQWGWLESNQRPQHYQDRFAGLQRTNLNESGWSGPTFELQRTTPNGGAREMDAR
jgi:hypothetical protein